MQLLEMSLRRSRQSLMPMSLDHAMPLLTELTRRIVARLSLHASDHSSVQAAHQMRARPRSYPPHQLLRRRLIPTAAPDVPPLPEPLRPCRPPTAVPRAPRRRRLPRASQLRCCPPQPAPRRQARQQLAGMALPRLSAIVWRQRCLQIKGMRQGLHSE